MGPDALLECVFAFLATFGWGFEGYVAGFGTILIDYRIGIAIRQVTAGVLELLIAFSALAIKGGGIGSVPELLGATITSPALLIFAISGLFAMPAYSFWYKGNSMCGTALGMARNGMYAFWGPLFIWIILGVLNMGGMSAGCAPLTSTQWIGAIVIVIGIFCIAVNPLEIVRKKQEELAMTSKLPLYYAIMQHFADGKPDCAEGVMQDLRTDYSSYKLFTRKDIEEALTTEKENGLLNECDWKLDAEGELQTFYAANDFGKDMIRRYTE